MMFDIPEQYRVQVKIALKDFIPRDLKPEKKKRIKEAIKEVKLVYQIAGEEIPSVMNKEYFCQVIQIYDIEIYNIKNAVFLSELYQSAIKSLCIIRFYDLRDEQYSLSLKRLNQNDTTKIVVEDRILTNVFPLRLPCSNRVKLCTYVEFGKVKNKTDKVNFYMEIFVKVYLLKYEMAYINTKTILDSDIWYNTEKIRKTLVQYKELISKRALLDLTVISAEKVVLIKEIKSIIDYLDKSIS